MGQRRLCPGSCVGLHRVTATPRPPLHLRRMERKALLPSVTGPAPPHTTGRQFGARGTLEGGSGRALGSPGRPWVPHTRAATPALADPGSDPGPLLVERDFHPADPPSPCQGRLLGPQGRLDQRPASPAAGVVSCPCPPFLRQDQVKESSGGRSRPPGGGGAWSAPPAAQTGRVHPRGASLPLCTAASRPRAVTLTQAPAGGSLPSSRHGAIPPTRGAPDVPHSSFFSTGRGGPSGLSSRWSRLTFHRPPSPPPPSRLLTAARLGPSGP